MSNNLYQDRDARLNTVVGNGAVYWAMLGRILKEAKDRDIHMQDWCEQEQGYQSTEGFAFRFEDTRDATAFGLYWL